MFPLLASIAFGFAKGLTAAQRIPVRTEQDLVGPVKEEFIYRAAPLWAFPRLPVGSTALLFAVDHTVSDYRKAPAEPSVMAARFGDVLLGGILYELAFRKHGLLGAVAAHVGHNLAVGLGSRAR